MKVGVIGGGQLGQMLAHAGHPLGIDVTCLDSNPDASAARGGTLVVGDLRDADVVRKWAADLDVITYESENVAEETIAALPQDATLRPGRAALEATQHRGREKALLDRLSIPVAPYRVCTTRQELLDSLHSLETPVIAKTATGGYDGKGQVTMNDESSLDDAAALLDHGDVVVEKKIAFDYEFSAIAVRAEDGAMRLYAPVANLHSSGILRVSAPGAKLNPDAIDRVTAYVTAIAIELDYVGVLALEMFVAGDEILANEIAPRVHNSGHWTIEGADTSQFENHLRAVCGLPLGSTSSRGHSVMTNIIGEHGDIDAAYNTDGAHLHLYGKSERPGRKLGHITVTAPTVSMMRQRFRSLESRLGTRWGLPPAIK